MLSNKNKIFVEIIFQGKIGHSNFLSNLLRKLGCKDVLREQKKIHFFANNKAKKFSICSQTFLTILASICLCSKLAQIHRNSFENRKISSYNGEVKICQNVQTWSKASKQMNLSRFISTMSKPKVMKNLPFVPKGVSSSHCIVLWTIFRRFQTHLFAGFDQCLRTLRAILYIFQGLYFKK